MSATSAYLESLLDETGGFSRFQVLMFSSVSMSKIGPVWSMLVMTFAGAIPSWSCEDDVHNVTSYRHSNSINSTLNSAQDFGNASFQQCYTSVNSTSDTCMSFRFDEGMNTVVSEWGLICDKDWVSSTITTIQMTGLLISGITAGHIADGIGRKPTYFMALLILVTCNAIAGFSVSWKMFAAMRFLLGFGTGCYLTVFYTFMMEFTPSKHRPVVVAFPSWALWACAFGFLSMWLHDWRYIHFATAIITVPWVLFWWVTPESFRYLVSHNRIEEAKEVVRRMARINGRPVPNLKKLRMLADLDQAKDRKYTVKDILTSRRLLKYTVLLGVGWLSCGYGYYAISFGVQSLSGNLYYNMFLLSVVEVPAQMSTYYLANKLGRKPTALGFFMISSMSSVVVAVTQITDFEMKHQLMSGFALAAKLGVAAGWSALMLLTTENYPTVVRNIGFGLQCSISRVGGMVAPQAVYLNHHHPGALYFICGGLLFISAVCMIFIPETKGKAMQDVINGDTTKGSPSQLHSLLSSDSPSEDSSGNTTDNLQSNNLKI
ncbi:solute carrier family 22 member 21-like [Mizuhopecten yessoensis]|uniref:Solute carrier family 22 member 21 n=1 Tax=Mizuhopecten yessoensis TaxID=6573 RepID=A0A210PU05_MIZYE|nr:solute carrier family 22 member 21-like [Mizuhopecten yessoensis]XP_021375229.1 solute carrier family 22 member 21-like [Mizuhopecten yessoensis]OWF39981.1 Solute carrier family 22 member 21 [Mizuhopecten yessoensis]